MSLTDATYTLPWIEREQKGGRAERKCSDFGGKRMDRLSTIDFMLYLFDRQSTKGSFEAHRQGTRGKASSSASISIH